MPQSGETYLHYQRYGHGPRCILAFHGFGQDAGCWRALAAALGPEVTVYAFDLFYHGQSRLHPQDAPLSKPRLLALLDDFLQQEDLRTFGLLAFSIGARFAFSLLERYPTRIEKIWLIAPDGLQRQFWYRLATAPGVRQVLRQALHRPAPVTGFLPALGRCRLIDARLVGFAKAQLQSRAQRLRVYHTWVAFRRLKFSKSQLQRLLTGQGIPVTFFLGQHDAVFPYAGIRTFLQQLPQSQTVRLNTGHTGLLAAVVGWVRQQPAAGRW